MVPAWREGKQVHPIRVTKQSPASLYATDKPRGDLLCTPRRVMLDACSPGETRAIAGRACEGAGSRHPNTRKVRIGSFIGLIHPSWALPWDGNTLGVCGRVSEGRIQGLVPEP